jgi:DNA-binding transcriptional LysR family regulator
MVNKTTLARIDLNLLVLFDIVMQERHVGRAGERLNLSSSAISHGLNRLRRLLNDPLFLKTPKGVVPTARATELAESIADILSRAGEVISSAAPFDPATSTRRFVIGAPDGVSAVLLPPLLSELERKAPRIDVSMRQLLPTQGETSAERAWRSAFVDLEARAMDVAVLPTEHAPARFESQTLFEEDFVVAMRADHAYAKTLTLDRYCEAKHLVVSHAGDPYGFVDRALEQTGRQRRIALTVPNFMLALAMIAESDMVAALPRRFVALHASRFGAIAREVPLPLESFQLNAIAPKVAMMDPGLAWFFGVLADLDWSMRRRRDVIRKRSS